MTDYQCAIRVSSIDSELCGPLIIHAMQPESLEVLEKVDFTKLDTSVHAELLALRTDMAVWRAELRGEIHACASSVTRQMYMALLGQMWVLLLGFAYFFAALVR